ncbi:tRNA (cytidine(56)-2'-O)-methyltransferase [Candidatus Micrarchaeota archaeon]|nr:MAG: tRNA (cytidine(56)-2'-O)-methyltransferase [Candidatus Micrarchaeota archaeon]
MIYVLRLGHRKGRDLRISTHCGLVARAFGADAIIYTGDYDKKMMESVKDVADRWGGNFKVFYEKQWKKFLSSFEGKIIHLTMYGLPVDAVINNIREIRGDKVIVIGGEKVPAELYKMADYNIAIGKQPHSEVAALAVFLDKLFKGDELNKDFENAKIKVIPQEKGKKVVEVNRYKSKQS